MKGFLRFRQEWYFFSSVFVFRARWNFWVCTAHHTAPLSLCRAYEQTNWLRVRALEFSPLCLRGQRCASRFPYWFPLPT